MRDFERMHAATNGMVGTLSTASVESPPRETSGTEWNPSLPVMGRLRLRESIMTILAALSLTTIGVIANPPNLPAGYDVETIDIPAEIKLGVGGLAFNPAGELVICTREGEVWRHRPSSGEWLKFADGLHESLGMWIDPASGDIYVIQRPELTRLVDEDKDGVADLYLTVNDEWGLTDNYHEYAFGPVRDLEGNFYGTLNTSLSWPNWAGSDRWDVGRVHDGAMGRAAEYRGWAFQITADGEFVPLAAGLRSPSGIGINRHDEIFYTDNQGDWNGSSSLNQIVKGRFYGHPSSLMDHEDFKGKDLNAIPVSEYERMFAKPAVWFIHGDLAHAPGEPLFDETGGKFGPFSDQIFVGDQTRSNLMRICLEKIGGEYQGAIFNFADPLSCGVMRQVFGPDGSMWVGETGRGWRSVGGKEFGLERITYDGTTLPVEMHTISATPSGFRLRFVQPMARAGLAAADAIQVQHWHYLYRPQYGSPKTDQTSVDVSNVRLSADGLELTFDVPMIEGKIYQISLPEAKSETGASLSNATGWYTLNRIPKS